MLRVILVDDELVILEDLKMMIEKYDFIEVVGIYTDPLEAIDALAAKKPDCVFLDIEMAGLNGIELAERISNESPASEVVFITAYNHYAAQAFEVNAIDYMLKPIRPERVERAVQKLVEKMKFKPQAKDASCSIKCFGTFEVIVGEHAIKWSRSKSKEFLAYMLQHEGKWVTKYKLCDEQWMDYSPEQALAYLQTSVYRLRKSLKDVGCDQIKIEYANDRYILRLGEVDYDVREFEQNYQRFMDSGSELAAKKALATYRGEYLEGEDWLWADIEREDYINRVEKLLDHLNPNREVDYDE